MRIPLVLLIFGSSLLYAQSRFEGTWEIDMGTLHFSSPPEEYLLNNGRYQCMSCVPKVDVSADGTEQAVKGQPYFDTIMVEVLDPSSVKFAFKKNGKPTFACTETVSPDGKTMTEHFTEDPTASQLTGHALFTRVNDGPSGSHALSGSWEMQTVRNVSPTGPTTTYHVTADGVSVSAGPVTFDAKFDGKDYPVKGDPTQMVSLKLIDDRTIEQTDKHDGKVMTVMVSQVSLDGKSISVTSTDKRRGGTMTFTAQKRP
jgi:hypothetical protein